MKTTSYFIWISLKPEIFSDIFVDVYNYIKTNNIENIVSFQNILSVHITLYYLEQNIDSNIKTEIKNYIKKMDIASLIKLDGFNYFYRWKNRFILYFEVNTKLDLKKYRDNLHKKFARNDVEDNSLKFVPHISFLKIKDVKLFEEHRENIEQIIKFWIEKIKNQNINTHKINLYAVNSNFKEEIQIII